MDFKKSLDIYLTTEPDNGFDSWLNLVYEYFSDDFFDKVELNIIGHNNNHLDKWLNKLFLYSYMPKESAIIIERAFNLYIKN